MELVATSALIFHDYVVSPQTFEGESLNQARRRIFKAGLEIEHEGKILHEMRCPDSMSLKWSKREE